MKVSTKHGIIDTEDDSWKWYWNVPIPQHLAGVVQMVEDGKITRQSAMTVMRELVEQNRRIIREFFNEIGFDIVIKD